jgi:hypothetical protein
MEEAVEWVRKMPSPMGGESGVQIRPVFEAEDFGADPSAGKPFPLIGTSLSARQGHTKNAPAKGALEMRFMMLMIPKGYESAPPGTVPEDIERVTAMMEYNESLHKAGVLLAMSGLHPPSMGARVSFKGGKPKVTDGPFAEAKEVLGGYWLIEVRSKEEAVEWASRCPASEDEVIEVRQVQALDDYPDNVQKVAKRYTELQGQG